MKLEDFDYFLPEERIARYPLIERSESRLMILNRQDATPSHHYFYQLADFLSEGDLLVFNDSRVLPARLYGKKKSGGKVEILIERIHCATAASAHVKASHLAIGHQIFVNEKIYFEVMAKQRLYDLKLKTVARKPEQELTILNILHAFGHIPLPHYMGRPDELADKDRYQTIYARAEGSVAAPTAGLHFDTTILAKLRSKGIEFAYVTLHVGAGTFQPVKAENIIDHQMHSELITLPAETVRQIQKAKAGGKRVIAVGTTSARTLEAAAQMHQPLKSYQGETDIFIYPGFQFKIIDGLITNFHLPKSSLLMLVAAFSSRSLILQAYQTAIAEQYRFFSYGDAMFIR